jgi:CheY-like chemotaxis protein
MKVLLVEDDPDTRYVLLEVLHDAGVQAQGCATGEEAIDVLRSGDFDVLVTDYVMPGMSGLDLVGLAGAIDAGLRCVVLSGYGPPRDVGVRWLKKPVSVPALLQAISEPPLS